MSKSFAAIAGFEHEDTLLTGYGELIDCVEGNLPLTPDAAYVDTVLKLDEEDYLNVDGNEGFLDSIKRGSIKVYEWIKQLLKSIKEWLFGKNKKDYEEAKKNVQKDVEWEKLLSDTVSLSSNPVDQRAVDEVAKLIRKVSIDDKTIINQEIEEAILAFEESNSLTKVRSDLTEKITGKVNTRLNSVITAINEINRIDKTGETFDKLNVDKRIIEDLEKAVTDLQNKLEKTPDHNLSDLGKELVKVTDKFQEPVSKSIIGLDKLNESEKNSEQQERSVSRAASIVKLMGTILNALRDSVITFDSQINIAIKEAQTAVYRKALNNALEQTTEATNRYIQETINKM